MEQQLLIQVSVMHTGSQFLTAILRRHPDISAPITSEQIKNGPKNDFQSTLAGELDVIMPDNMIEQMKTILPESEQNKKYILFVPYAHELWAIPYILLNQNKYGLICSMRHPAKALRTAYMRNEINTSLMSCFLNIVYFIKRHDNVYAVQIDKYAEMDPQERVIQFAEGFERITGLKLTPEMEDYIIRWRPVNPTTEFASARDITESEKNDIIHRIRASCVLDYLRSVGIEYDWLEI